MAFRRRAGANGQSPAGAQGKRVQLDDVNFLLDKLRNYAYLWEEIGTALNFHPGALNNLRYSPHLVTLQQRLKALLVQWCEWPNRDHPRVPTMEMLREALANHLVGLPEVGARLYEDRYDLPSWQERVQNKEPGFKFSIPLQFKIVLFIIFISVTLFLGANMIPLVLPSLVMVYVVGISMAIIMFLGGYYFLESFNNNL